MSNETRDSRQKGSSSAQGAYHFIWPLSNSLVPDEMNTSFDADEEGLIVVCGDFNADLDEVPVEAIRGDVEFELRDG